MSGDVFSPLTIPVLGDGRVVVQWNVLLALSVSYLLELLERPITRITRLDFGQNVEAIYCAGFKLLERDIFCWGSIIPIFERTVQQVCT